MVGFCISASHWPHFHGHARNIWFKIKDWVDIEQDEENEQSGKIRAQGKMAAAGKVCMLCLLEGAEFLLDLHVRVHDLFELHGRKSLGNDL
jgi:hypothetical protein